MLAAMNGHHAPSTAAPRRFAIGGRAGGHCLARCARIFGIAALEPLLRGAAPFLLQRGQRVEALVRAHHREIVVGHNLRDIEHLVQHRAVLPGRDDHRRKARVVAQQVDQREELDRLRPGAEDDRNLERRIGVRAGHVARLRKIG